MAASLTLGIRKPTRAAVASTISFSDIPDCGKYRSFSSRRCRCARSRKSTSSAASAGSGVSFAAAGGFGTGGRWTLKDGLLEVIRTTPLGLVTGRDYYMAEARAGVDDKLQFTLRGIIRSYNALYPVMVIADFEATRRPGRFVRDVDDDDE